ncbi:MAG: PpiC-type peptidyl-prolyl cis-trans isomerase [Verrucomicrobia bacterium]|nr:PpiC-type peptidyl-prolyl cis-trans isomerase [Verrucomicrobiota bacterium]
MMLGRRLSLTFLALAAGSVTRAQQTADSLNLRFANGIAAVAEDKVITVDDVRREISPLIPQLQREARSEREFNEKLETLQDDVIQQLIDRVLIVKEFRKDEKKHIPLSFIDNRIADIQTTEFDNDRSKFLAYLRSRSTTLADYKREVEESIIYDYMRGQQRKSQSLISPVRIETFYRENKDRFYQEDGVHLRLIQFNRNNGESDSELTAKANVVVARLNTGEKFEDLAKEYSQDSRRTKGGDWGWQKRSDLKPAFSDPLFTLKKGETTAPVLTPEGCFLLFVEERKYAGIQPLDDVRDQIERILVQQMAQVSQERWLERLRRNGYVKHY